MDLDRFPKSTFAKDMAIESKYQIASELSGNYNNMTLHSDGKAKHGHSYKTFDVINEQGKLLVCGLREVGAADAKSHLDLYFVKSGTMFVAAWKIKMKS